MLQITIQGRFTSQKDLYFLLEVVLPRGVMWINTSVVKIKSDYLVRLVRLGMGQQSGLVNLENRRSYEYVKTNQTQ